MKTVRVAFFVLLAPLLSGGLRAQTKDSLIVELSRKWVHAKAGDAYDIGLRAQGAVATAQLDRQVKFFAGPMTIRQILLLLHDHQSHHLGQVIVYLRLKGIKPPDYVGW